MVRGCRNETASRQQTEEFGGLVIFTYNAYLLISEKKSNIAKFDKKIYLLINIECIGMQTSYVMSAIASHANRI